MPLQRRPEPSAGRQASTAPAAPDPYRDSAPGCGSQCRCLRWSSPAFLAAPQTSRDGSSVSPSPVEHSPEEAQVSEHFRDYSLSATSIAVPQRLQIWSFHHPFEFSCLSVLTNSRGSETGPFLPLASRHLRKSIMTCMACATSNPTF